MTTLEERALAFVGIGSPGAEQLLALLREVDASAREEARTDLATARAANEALRSANRVKCARCSQSPHWKDAIRCAECKAYFCEAPCLMDHFASSGDDFKLGGLRAQKHMASIMSWLAEVEELRRVLLRISNAHIIKTMGGDIVDAEVCQWAADALCRPMGTTPGTAEPPRESKGMVER